MIGWISNLDCGWHVGLGGQKEHQLLVVVLAADAASKVGMSCPLGDLVASPRCTKSDLMKADAKAMTGRQCTEQRSVFASSAAVRPLLG